MRRIVSLGVLAITVMSGCSGSTKASPSAGPSATPPAGSETASAPVSGVLVSVPGTHVSLIPPQGFTPATTFTGFESPAGASILVVEMPAAYEEIVAGLTDAGLSGQGIAVSSRKTVTVDGRESLLVEGTQRAVGVDFGKILLVTGTDSLVAMLTGNYGVGDAGVGDAIRVSLMTVAFRPESSADPLAALNFTITPAAPLKFAGTLSNAALYDTSGKLPAADKNEPSFTVAPSIGVSAPIDLDTFPAERLKSLATIKNAVIESSSPVSVAGLDGVELIATADHYNRPGQVMVYEVFLITDTGYVLMVGKCDIDVRDTFLPVFRATAESYRPKS